MAGSNRPWIKVVTQFATTPKWADGIVFNYMVLVGVGPLKFPEIGGAVPNLTAYRGAFVAAIGFALVGAFIAQRVPDKDAAVTMRVRGAGAEPILAPAD